MPTIPRVEGPEVGASFTATAKKQNLPPVSNAVGEGLVQGLSAFAKAKAEVDNKRYEADAENAVLAYNKGKRELFYNPETGYFNTNGKTSYDEATPTEENLGKLRESVIKELGLKPESIRIYDRVTKADMSRSADAIFKHASKGNQQYMIATKDAIVEDSMEKASLFWSDGVDSVDQHGNRKPSDFLLAMQAGEDALVEKLKIQGITDGKAYQEALDDYTGGMYAAKVSGALTDGSPEALQSAAEDMDAFIDDIDPATYEKLKTELNRQQDVQYVDQQVTAIRDAAPGDLRAQRDAANAETDPERKAEIKRQLTNQNTIDERIESQERFDMFNDWSFRIGDQGDSYDSIPMEQRELMTDAQRKSLKALEDDKAAGKEYKTDWPTYTEIYSNWTEDDWKAVDNPLEYRDKLDDTRYMQFVQNLDKVKNGKDDEKSKQKFTELRTTSQQLNEFYKSVFGKQYNTEKNAPWINEFNNQLQATMDGIEKTSGKKLTPIEKSDLINSFIGSTNLPNASLGHFDKEVELDEIPLDELSNARRMTASMGLPANADNWIYVNRGINQVLGKDADEDVQATVRQEAEKEAKAQGYTGEINDAIMLQTYIDLLTSGRLNE